MRFVIGLLTNLWKIYIGCVFSIFAVLLYPFFLIVLIRNSWKKYSFKLFIVWSWLMRIFCFYHVRTLSRSPLPEGPHVIVANHTSYLDIFFMYSILPKHPFVFLGKSEILTYPIIRTYFKNLNIPVFRNEVRKVGMSYVLASKAIQEGWSLVIFPEGTIPMTDIPKPIAFKNGAFKIAKEANIPIVPLTFTNNYKLFSDPTMFYGPARPGISEIHIHPFISKDEVTKLSFSELKKKSFDLIDAPIRKQYPHLYMNEGND